MTRRLQALFCLLLATGVGHAGEWHDSVDFQNQHASIVAGAHGGFVLTHDAATRQIDAQAWHTDTASPLFDGLFAMAQADMKLDSVDAIRDGSFDHGQPIACHCFMTGARWHFVWTRDLSYSVDLGLWRFDPERSRQTLAFKLSEVREPSAPQGLLVMQDTGSGGSWPISTDRVAWFLGARHLLDDKPFATRFDSALVNTLAQDKLYLFDPVIGLYRGETSFLDWREQTYPRWTADNVTFIGQSFALSTNVLHYEALRLAAARDLPGGHYAVQADALKKAINLRFWRADRGMYMSYIGGDVAPAPVDTYDLLGLSLAITSGVADATRARQSLANYPAWPAGSPVIWPERRDQPIYHNRAIWPFVSSYALRAARRVDAPAQIAFQVQSLIRGAALAGSNMENFELASQSIHVDEGPLSGPVIDSQRQIWSVAGYLQMVIEGVFGVGDDQRIEPKIPTSLLPMLFGDRKEISLTTTDRRIVLRLPTKVDGNLLVKASSKVAGDTTYVTLKAIKVDAIPMRTDAPLYAPSSPDAPKATPEPRGYALSGGDIYYVNGQHLEGHRLARSTGLQCVSATRKAASGLESLPSPETCVGDSSVLPGAGPWTFTAPRAGNFLFRISYSNYAAAVDSGITAAVRRVQVRCGDGIQTGIVVMSHSVRTQLSTPTTFHAGQGQACAIDVVPGFNMSYLTQFAHFTEAIGGITGPSNASTLYSAEVSMLP